MGKWTLATSANNKKIYSEAVTIASGASKSTQVDIGSSELVAICMPAAWTTAVITFESSCDNGVTFQSVVDAAGAEVGITLPVANTHIALSFAGIKGLTTIKVVSGTAAGLVAQGADRELTLIIKEE